MQLDDARQFERRRAMRRVVFTTLLVVAGYCSGCTDARVRLTPLEKADLERRAEGLLMRAAASDIDVARCNAIEALVDVRGARAVSVYRTALKSKSAMVRFAGLVALGDVRDRDSLNEFIAALRDDHPLVRLAAAFAAHRCGETGQGRVLLAALKDSPDEHVRAEAAHLIGKLGEGKAAAVLRSATRDKSGLVAVQASAALAELGESDGIDRLIEYAYGELNSRMLALQGLSRKPDERARDTLTFILNNPDEYIETRLAAARGLGGLNSKAGFDIAERSMSHTDKDQNEQARVRVLAATALGAIGDERGLPALRDAAESSSDERVQIAASYAMLQILRTAEPTPAKRKP